MHIGVTSHLWLKSALHASSHPCMCTCVLRLGRFLLDCLCSLFRPTVLLPALPDVHLRVQREVQVQPLVRLPLGDRGHSVHETPLTGYEPKKDLNLVNTEELDLAATSDVYWQHTLDDDASFNDPNVDDNQIAKYLAVIVDSTRKLVEMRSNNDQFSGDTRILKSAQSHFPVVA